MNVKDLQKAAQRILDRRRPGGPAPAPPGGGQVGETADAPVADAEGNITAEQKERAKSSTQIDAAAPISAPNLVALANKIKTQVQSMSDMLTKLGELATKDFGFALYKNAPDVPDGPNAAVFRSVLKSFDNIQAEVDKLKLSPEQLGVFWGQLGIKYSPPKPEDDKANGVEGTQKKKKKKKDKTPKFDPVPVPGDPTNQKGTSFHKAAQGDSDEDQAKPPLEQLKDVLAERLVDGRRVLPQIDWNHLDSYIPNWSLRQMDQSPGDTLFNPGGSRADTNAEPGSIAWGLAKIGYRAGRPLRGDDIKRMIEAGVPWPTIAIEGMGERGALRPIMSEEALYALRMYSNSPVPVARPPEPPLVDARSDEAKTEGTVGWGLSQIPNPGKRMSGDAMQALIATGVSPLAILEEVSTGKTPDGKDSRLAGIMTQDAGAALLSAIDPEEIKAKKDSALADKVEQQSKVLNDKMPELPIADSIHPLLADFNGSNPDEALRALLSEPDPRKRDLLKEILFADELSPTERAMLSKIKDPNQYWQQRLQIYMQKQMLLSQMLTQLAQMRYEALKQVAQNLRG